jgi:hypothetical protein
MGNEGKAVGFPRLTALLSVRSHERAANQKHQTVMIVTGSDSDWEYLTSGKINPSKGNVLLVEGAMIDALFNLAVFAALALCIVGFGAWAHKRVDAR